MMNIQCNKPQWYLHISQPWDTCIELWSDARDTAAWATFGNQWICIPFAGKKEYLKQFPIAWRELYIVVIMYKNLMS